MSTNLAKKLSVTAAVLGCSSRKELCARFRTVNPATEFDLDRSYKWLQGRSMPRSQQVYEDWARLICTQRSGTWLSACSTEAFLDEICELFSADRDQLVGSAAAFGGAAWDDALQTDAHDPVCGLYVAYSWAWSPYQRGKLIRGFFRLAPSRRARLEAHYAENLASGLLGCIGAAVRDGQVLHAEVQAPSHSARERMFFSLLVPGRPANVLCGHLQGVVIVGPDPHPSSSRVAMIRISHLPEETKPKCYLHAEAGELEADLRSVACPGIASETLAEEILRFLSAGPAGAADGVTLSDLAAIAALVDRAEAPAMT